MKLWKQFKAYLPFLPTPCSPQKGCDVVKDWGLGNKRPSGWSFILSLCLLRYNCPT